MVKTKKSEMKQINESSKLHVTITEEATGNVLLEVDADCIIGAFKVHDAVPKKGFDIHEFAYCGSTLDGIACTVSAAVKSACRIYNDVEKLSKDTDEDFYKWLKKQDVSRHAEIVNSFDDTEVQSDED